MSNFLIEIFTEELPPTALKKLSTSLVELSLDFLDKDSNFFIDSTLEPVIDYDNSLWSSYEGNWVEASVSSTKRKMRECFELSKEELSKRGKQSSLFMKDYLSLERCAKIWEKVLEI